MSSARSTAAVSMPAARISSACVERVALQTLHHEHAAGHELAGAGAARPRASGRRSRSSRAMSSMFSASSRKSSSSEIVSANSSTSAGGFASAATGMRPTRNGAIQAIARRSLRHEPRDLRPLHLDHDLLARAQPRRVHLRDRRRGEALLVEAREHLLERPAELLLDDRAHDRERLGRHAVAQAAELVRRPRRGRDRGPTRRSGRA